MEDKKYDVKINETKGSCNEELFKKMVMNGDIAPTKIAEIIGMQVTINGSANVTITTAEKTFNINYFDTEEYGIISSGSEIFAKSVEDYITDSKVFRITEIKTKKGKTYKAIPVLGNKTTVSKEETKSEELPF